MSTVNPALPYTTITIRGTEYKMAATHRALAIAEDDLVRRGHDVNLLVAKLRPSMSGIRAQFAASLHTYHPELDFEDAKDLVDDDSLADVINALHEAGKQGLPAPSADKPATPPQPEK